jgi:hypothetical protein
METNMTKNENLTTIENVSGKWAIAGKKTVIYFSGTCFDCTSDKKQNGEIYNSEEREEMKSNRVSTNTLADPS